MRIVSGYQNTKSKGQDIALTPYLFGVYCKLPKIYGIGIQCFYFAFYVGIGFNIPKGYGGFRVIP